MRQASLLSCLACFISLPKSSSWTLQGAQSSILSRTTALSAKKQTSQQHHQQQQGAHFSQHLYKPEITETTDSSISKTFTPHHSRSSNGVRTIRGDSELAVQHAQRLAAAGRVGTLYFQDPSRVFIGNLDLSVTSDDLAAWICDQHGTAAHRLLHAAEVVYDWQTGKSKGFGFVRYQEDMQATVALTQLNGRIWNNRKVSVKPANLKQKNLKEIEKRTEEYKEREKRRQERAEASAIPAPLVIEPEEAYMLQNLDPDLLQGVIIRGQDQPVLHVEKKPSKRMDDDIDSNLNRANRRKAAKSRPKRKPVNRGFG